MHDRQPWFVANNPRYQVPQYSFIANQNQFEVGMHMKSRICRAHDNLGATIAAHRIEGNY
jgi:hypothetical protein